jgi:hypothetical protein
MNNLEIEHLDLDRDQRWLSQTDKFKDGIPSGYVIDKFLPNIGGTESELRADRNSIITEFNSPVLEGKMEALDQDGLNRLYPNILIVMSGVEIPTINKYLRGPITPKKIMCTSDAYMSKVKVAIERDNPEFNLYKDFFMLIDEFDKLTKDKKFRKKITACLTDFFLFESRSMISATAMIPSDPRFAAKGFKFLKIRPTYDCKKDITLHWTNNVFCKLSDEIKRLRNNDLYIFINSPTLIHSIISMMKIESESMVFCSEDAKLKLKRHHNFTIATTSPKGFKRYNFLTSRFFSAVDIKVPANSHVIMVTHVNEASYTMLDPYSDSVQIFGRLRNGMLSLSHIFNLNPRLEVKSAEDLKNEILTSVTAHKMIEKTKNQFEKLEQGNTSVFDQALTRHDYANFVDEFGDFDYFLFDNYLLTEKTKGYYRNIKLLTEAYQATGFFNVTVKPIAPYDQTDKDLFINQRRKAGLEYNESFGRALDKYDNRPPGVIIFDFSGTTYDLRKNDPVLSEIYDDIKLEGMISSDFKMNKMKTLQKDLKKNRLLNNKDFVNEIKSLYKLGDIILFPDIVKALQTIYNKYGIIKVASARQIERYYKARPTKNKLNINVYEIMGSI